MNKVDEQYLELLSDVYEHGFSKDTRSGKTRSKFGKTMRFDLNEGFPLLTTKKVYFKGIVHELLWFLHGETNIRYLVENNVHIWDDDAYRFYGELLKTHNEIEERAEGEKMNKETKEEFLESVINDKVVSFNEYKNGNFYTRKYKFGDLGPVYGRQWRSFGFTKFDQIQNIINTLKNNPDDRRMLCVAFNPDMIDDMALPPCHVIFQFYSRKLDAKERWELYFKKFNNKIPVESEKLIKYGESKQYLYNGEHDGELDKENIPTRALSCFFYCRSQDLPLGTPYNIASYALLAHIIAHCTGMAVGDLIYGGGDCHIYENQLEGVKEQLSRDPHKYELPELEINPEKKDLEDIRFDDIKLIGYDSYPSIKFPLSVG